MSRASDMNTNNPTRICTTPTIRRSAAGHTRYLDTVKLLNITAAWPPPTPGKLESVYYCIVRKWQPERKYL